MSPMISSRSVTYQVDNPVVRAFSGGNHPTTAAVKASKDAGRAGRSSIDEGKQVNIAPTARV